jgi:hypothetical protein
MATINIDIENSSYQHFHQLTINQLLTIDQLVFHSRFNFVIVCTAGTYSLIETSTEQNRRRFNTNTLKDFN